MLKTIYKNLFLLLIIVTSFDFTIFAQDTTYVQTFTFKDILKRRGTWKFPDNPNDYRKILLYYTLKCDPRTAWDKYNCGEWDYLTYNIVHVPTSKFDSTKLSHPYFKIGYEAPDTLRYTMTKTFDTYQKKIYSKIQDSIISENEFKISDGNTIINTGKKINRIQFVIRKAELLSSGFTKGSIDKIKLRLAAVSMLNNFTIKFKNTSDTTLTSFDNDRLITVWQNNFINSQEQLVEFFLTEPFNWSQFLNLLVDISYEVTSDDSASVLLSEQGGTCLISSGEDGYLEFDGKNDYIDCTNISELNNTDKFTFEAYVNVKNWKAGSQIMGVDGSISLELGQNQGDINCIIRNPDDSYGTARGALQLNQWKHIAMVYDGHGTDDKDKLKLYIDGKIQTLNFHGNIPEKTSVDDKHFTIGGNDFAAKGLDGSLDEIRIWLTAMPSDVIELWKEKTLDSTHISIKGLVSYFNIDDDSGTVLMGDLNTKYIGGLIGIPDIVKFRNDEILKNPVEINLRPVITLIRGNYISHPDSLIVTDYIRDKKISIVTYEIKEHLPTIMDIAYAYSTGWSYTYLPNGIAIDSVFTPNDQVIYNYKLDYYSKPYELTDDWEIGRFITPYGIGLDLGPDGFTWIYDVTDYAPILKGNVDISAGNFQELLDMKFAFIKGTPPRIVKNIQHIWGPMKSYSYQSLSDDKSLSNVKLMAHPEANMYKVKARLTGHGHESNNGQAPWCCEWKDNSHFLYVNGAKAGEWHIFQYDECKNNPVYPQGGTWPHAREGWCPGDIVRDNEFEITSYMDGDSIKFDYDITKVPNNNEGMGRGNYVVNFDLIEYATPTSQNDAEIYDVIAPNDWEYYSRNNPVCMSPRIIVRNNSTANSIDKLKFLYGVSGGEQFEYNWKSDLTGPIQKNEKREIILPVPDSKFWLGDGKNIFTVTVKDQYGNDDEYTGNDNYSTHFNIPDLYKQNLVLKIKTSHRPWDYHLIIKDIEGKEVIEMSFDEKGKIYDIPLDFPNGCYTVEFTDVDGTGLSYWLYEAAWRQGQIPEYIAGSFNIYDESGKIIKSFETEFGDGIHYSFHLGDITYITESGYENLLSIFPNPSEHNIELNCDYEIGNTNLTIYDLDGKRMFSENIYMNNNFRKVINTAAFPDGTYYLKISGAKYNFTKNFVKK